MRANYFMWVSLVVSISFTTANAGQAVAIANADTIVSTLLASENFGRDNMLRVGNSTFQDTTGVTFESRQRALISFDLSEIPANAQVTGATLQMFQLDAFTVGDGMHVFDVEEAWEELAVNWLNRPRTGEALGTMQMAPLTFVSFVSHNMTALVQKWVNGTKANHGLEIRFHDELISVRGGAVLGDIVEIGQTADTLLSREYSNPEWHPRLIVDFTVPEPSTFLLASAALPCLIHRPKRQAWP